MSPRTSRLFVVGLSAVMVLIATIAIVTRPIQYRLPMDPRTELTEDLVVEKTAEVLRLHHLEPIEPLPNPSDASVRYAPWPDNPVYGYIHWRVASPGGAGEQVWEVQVKQLEDEFIGWPERVD